MRWTAVLAALLLAAAVAPAADEPPLPEVAAALQRIAGRSTIEITTTGRRSGQEHTNPVWFVVTDGKILLQAGKDGQTDWYQNLKKNPAVVLRQGDYTFRGRAVPVDDPRREEEIHQFFRHKYTRAWLASLFNSSIGAGRPVEVTPISVAVRR